MVPLARTGRFVRSLSETASGLCLLLIGDEGGCAAIGAAAHPAGRTAIGAEVRPGGWIGRYSGWRRIRGELWTPVPQAPMRILFMMFTFRVPVEVGVVWAGWKPDQLVSVRYAA